MERLARRLSFRGRADRLEYWRLQIFAVAVAGASVMLTVLAAPILGQACGVFMLPVLPVAVASLAVLVRRLHDRTKSGWWIVAFFIAPALAMAWAGERDPDATAPVTLVLALGALALDVWGLVEVGLLRGAPGPNKYGAEPGKPPADEVFA